MTKKKIPPGPKDSCDLCKGKGWFYTRSMWPAQCHRCFPNLPRSSSAPPGPQRPATTQPKEYATGDSKQQVIE